MPVWLCQTSRRRAPPRFSGVGDGVMEWLVTETLALGYFEPHDIFHKTRKHFPLPRCPVCAHASCARAGMFIRNLPAGRAPRCPRRRRSHPILLYHIMIWWSLTFPPLLCIALCIRDFGCHMFKRFAFRTHTLNRHKWTSYFYCAEIKRKKMNILTSSTVIYKR